MPKKNPLIQELERLAKSTNCLIRWKGDRVVIKSIEGKSYNTSEFHPRAAYAYLRARFNKAQIRVPKMKKEIPDGLGAEE